MASITVPHKESDYILIGEVLAFVDFGYLIESF